MTAVFWVTTVIAVISGVNVILQRNPIYSALFLVANLFCVAVYYLLLNAQFLALVQIIVYAGAIMVLFLFVITLLSPGREETGEDPLQAYRIPAALLAIVLAAVLIAVLAGNPIKGAGGTATLSDCVRGQAGQLGCVNTIGDQLFNTYLFPFEVTSFLLLLAMLGAVVLAKRKIG